MQDHNDPDTLKIPAYLRNKAIISHSRQRLLWTALDRKEAGVAPNSKKKTGRINSRKGLTGASATTKTSRGTAATRGTQRIGARGATYTAHTDETEYLPRSITELEALHTRSRLQAQAYESQQLYENQQAYENQMMQGEEQEGFHNAGRNEFRQYVENQLLRKEERDLQLQEAHQALREMQAKMRSPQKGFSAKPRKYNSAGEITHYLDKINVAIIKLTCAVKENDTLIIEGSAQGGQKFLFTQPVKEMQIDKQPVSKAASDDHIGLKVNFPAEVGGAIYKV